jgi:hypothetical protein
VKSRKAQHRPAVAAPPVQLFGLRSAILILAALCLSGLFSTEIADPDFWWHLKTGEYIAQHGSLPVPDPFSFTTNLGKPMYAGEEKVRNFNLTHEWLAQVILYAIYRVTGFPGIVLFKTFLLLGFCGLAGLIAARRTGNFYDGLAAALAAAAIASEFSVDRPALITFFMTALFIAIVEFGWKLWLLPVLTLAWANCHGGFFLGWVVLGAYSAEILWRRGRALEDRDWQFLAMAALSVLLSGLNPNYFRIGEILWLYRRSPITAALIEWRRPYLWGPPYAFDILLYVAGATLLIWRRKVRLADWLLYIAFGAAALLSFRNIILIALVAPMIIVTYFPWRPKLSPKMQRAVSYAALAVLFAWLGSGLARGDGFRFRAAQWRYPAGAAKFLLDHHITGPIFNTWDYGGYLIWSLWPQQRVFIDGRALNESVNKDYRRALLNPGGQLFEMGDAREEVFVRYQIEAIVMNCFEYTTGTIYPLALALAMPDQTDWKLVYDDGPSMIFLRHPPLDMPFFSQARVLDHLEAECQMHVDRDPENSLCARTLGFLFIRTKNPDRARRQLGLYLAHPYGGPDPEATQAYRQLFK